MKELIKVTDNAVDGRALYEFLEIKHKFNDWIRNSIRDYGFKEGKDFSYFLSESTGGRPAKEYAVSVTMAKELSMVAKTEKGKNARLYFIKCEELAREAYVNNKTIRLAGIETRKTLTDTIQESGENERMHGRGYSNYTRMVYEVTGLTPAFDVYKGMMKARGLKASDFRETLKPGELKRVELAESLIKPLLELDKQYSEIKDTLKPLLEKKDIE